MAQQKDQQGDREVKPGHKRKRGSAGAGAKARRAERGAEKRIAVAERDIEARTHQRHEAWRQGGQPVRTARLTADIKAYRELRAGRRELYAEEPDLEGDPYERRQPGGMLRG